MDGKDKLSALISTASKIVIVQADNPDGDSLGSAIGLEQIFTDLNKEAYLFCAVSIPPHLKYLPGWSRVVNELPSSFDLTVIVDTSSKSLLENINSTDLVKIQTKPIVVLDHHQTEATIDFASLIINQPVVATGELIYKLSIDLKWPLNSEAKDMLAVSILSDSLGLMSANTSSSSIRAIADLVDGGVNLTHIDNLRKQTYRKTPELTKYKGQLLTRIENYLDNRLAIITIPWEEIEQYSPLYNPPMLIMEDMRLIENNAIAIAIKSYNDGHLTVKIRTNEGYPIAAKLAEHFGGGGHDYASGIKTTEYNLSDLKKEIILTSKQLLDEVSHETV
ncbi:MAG: DHH family phosphoesterase [Candidatus Saccharimonadales bacterium]